ncbi:putative secreted protein (Por secretion system target) [Ulvibacter sp. MAR_2010_11]|uniref:T9SS type A sorting domain-containing protein n=1 Tax=Ulvibacter sp. MAR_2010_11 TaxID=1250229 RepID=UPI000C2CDA30|nr:Omp28-related outer membrane protein [Ulvibacter sp. MAR_2010_11]PKA82321.1 putative secreted protein (Por secretion system target) [Ulvibacter sp. MAR_2010_11]
MLKKLPTSLIFLLLATFSYGQTIVSTTPENKKVVLEEFTGLHCVWCPDGHAIAKAIQDNNPGNVFLINIHAGGFAVPSGNEPDFRTPDGEGIRSYFGANSYPSGMVNRHIFSGSTPVMGRGSWTGAANTTLGQGSYVNVAVEAEIDVSTNELTVHVEAYYTGNSPQATNMLNVALLQNNTLGPQTGGNMGNEYVHMHRLVKLITGQWGVSISPTTTGSFIDQTFTYTIPAMYNNVPTELADMEIVAFVSETQSEIPSGAGAFPTYTGFANANDVYARYVDDIDVQCGFDITPKVNIQNVGADPLTALAINYSVNGGATQTYNWTGNLTSLQNETVELPAVSYTTQPVNTVEVTLENDDNNSNNSVSGTFDNAPAAVGTVTMILNTGSQGSQCTWDIVNSAGATVYSGGPYGNNETINETFEFTTDCYRFSVYDSGNNGGGSIVLYDTANEVMYSSNGNYGSGDSGYFSSGDILGTGESALERIVLYPNPASAILNIANAENATVTIYNLLGQEVASKTVSSNSDQIEVSRLQTGTYLVKITIDNAVKVERLVISN